MTTTTNSHDSSSSHAVIADRARRFWQDAGSPEGRDLEFWLAAESELRRESDDVQATAHEGGAQQPPRGTAQGNEPAGKTPARARQPAKAKRR
jgi:Protein of unknown function (DUF2934).